MLNPECSQRKRLHAENLAAKSHEEKAVDDAVVTFATLCKHITRTDGSVVVERLKERDDSAASAGCL